MIQNISQKRNDKQITRDDLYNIAKLAWNTIRPAVFPKSGSFGDPWIAIAHVQGNADNTATSIWGRTITPHPPVYGLYSHYTTLGWWGTQINSCSNCNPSKIYPSLKIGAEEKKILIEVKVRIEASRAKKAIGLYLVTPKVPSNQFMLNSVVIFTPKPGLFSDTAPS